MERMTAGERMVRRALERSREKEGERTGVRMSAELKRRAEACAAACRDELGEWVNKACIQLRSGSLDGVAFEQKTIEATRGESEKVWVRVPKGMDPKTVRLAVAAACARAEQTALPEYAGEGAELVEGKDYWVERAG